MGHYRRHWFGPDEMAGNPDRYTLEASGMTRRDSVAVISMTFTDRTHGTKTVFELDPSRGYLPIYISARYKNSKVINGNPNAQALLTATRDCGEGRWFPDRYLYIRTPAQTGEEYSVLEMRVTELDVTTKPTAADLSVKLPAGTEICSMKYVNPLHRFRLKQDETVSPDQISGLFEMLERASPDSLMDTAIPPAPSPYRWLWALATAGVCGIAWLLWKLGMPFLRSRVRWANSA
jgi:hypothetical protein